jgi:hypothetical protein
MRLYRRAGSDSRGGRKPVTRAVSKGAVRAKRTKNRRPTEGSARWGLAADSTGSWPGPQQLVANSTRGQRKPRTQNPLPKAAPPPTPSRCVLQNRYSRRLSLCLPLAPPRAALLAPRRTGDTTGCAVASQNRFLVCQNRFCLRLRQSKSKSRARHGAGALENGTGHAVGGEPGYGCWG